MVGTIDYTGTPGLINQQNEINLIKSIGCIWYVALAMLINGFFLKQLLVY